MLGYILLASLLTSSGAVLAIFILALKKELLDKILLFLISGSAGGLLGAVFFDLLPESLEFIPAENLFLPLVISFIIFYFIEKVLHWRHCHKGQCEIHTFGYMNLIGDSIHNFIDGLIIAATFMVDIQLGITATIAIFFHEIPQEIGDFGVLLYSGVKKGKAILLNLMTALFSILGAVTGYFLSFYADTVTSYLLPFAAAGFLYVAMSDLIPEIRKEENLKKSAVSFICFLFGIAIIYFVTRLE